MQDIINIAATAEAFAVTALGGALANSALGAIPANNVAFAPMLFGSVDEFLASLKRRGIMGGSGTPITYPGPGHIDATNVTNRPPGGPAASGAGR